MSLTQLFFSTFTTAAPTPPTPGTDPYYSYVSLLTHYDGLNDQTMPTVQTTPNNSPLAQTATLNGSVVLTATNYKFGPKSANWSSASSGSSISLTTDSSLQFGTGDFTVEGWFYLTSGSGFRPLFSIGSYTAGILMRYQGGTDGIYINGSSYDWAPGTNFALNQWNHVAISRSGTNLYAFVNGTGVLSSTNSSNLVPSTTTNLGMSTHNSGEVWEGYIDEVRITKGVARYTSNFSVPTQPFPNSYPSDPYYNNVSVLLHLDALATPGVTGFIDNSQYGFYATASGTPIIKTAVEKYGNSSVYIAGDNTVNFASDAAFAIGTSDFTFETWIYINSWSPSYQSMINIGSYASGMLFRFSNSGDTIQFFINGTGYNFSLGAAPSTATWHHIAISRNSGNVRVFVDGVQKGSTTAAAGSIAAGNVKIGASQHIGGEYINGYLDELRLTNGVGRYTANFTPQTYAFSNNGPDPYYSSVALLLHMDGTSGSTTFTDNSFVPNTVTANGNAQVNTSIVKYGTGSAYFDGIGGYLDIPNNSQFYFGSDNFTVEFWINTTRTADAWIVGYYAANPQNPTSISFSVIIYNGIYYLDLASGSNETIFQIGTTGQISNNSWHHIACTRSGNTVYTFLDGTLVTSTAYSSTLNNPVSAILRIGGSSGTFEDPYDGYIDDLRITKNVARYTTNFTPPTSAFPNS